MTVASEQGVYYDPYDVDINADPYPTFKRLRDEAPLYYNERYDVWALSRHVDVEKALVDWQTFSSSRGDILEVVQSGMENPGGVILWEDPPTHTKLRGLMSRVFSPRRMDALAEQVRSYCASCLDPFVGAERFDFVKDLGGEMPMRVIGMLLGIPESDQEMIRDHSDKVLRTDPGKPMQVNEAVVVRGSLFADYIDWRAKHPSDDLMTALLDAEFEDETGKVRKLTRQEVLTYTEVVAGAGNETTGRLIGWLGKVLGDHPDQRREDRSGPVADPERDRRDAPLRADGPARRPLRRGTPSTTGRRCRPGAQCCCSSAPRTAMSAATPTRIDSTSIATKDST